MISPRKFMIATLVLLLLLFGCTPAAVTQIPPEPATLVPSLEPTLAPVVPTDTPLPFGLTLDMLKNMSIQLPSSQRTVTLVNGRFSDTNPDKPLEAALTDFYAFSDVNGDGLDDAVVIVWENTGGSGMFESLVLVLNQDGVPLQAGTFSLGDRVQINNVTIDSSGAQKKILVDMLVHGPNDALCCPSFPVVATYQYTKSGLELTRLVSKIADGTERAINIESPENGAQVSGSVQVTGTVTIAPFENNLAYRIYDATGAELAVGPFPVNATDMGGPGTFDNTIDLSSIPAGLVVRLQLQDLNMADGSMIAMDSVELVVK
jgi:hypothetical protein